MLSVVPVLLQLLRDGDDEAVVDILHGGSIGNIDEIGKVDAGSQLGLDDGIIVAAGGNLPVNLDPGFLFQLGPHGEAVGVGVALHLTVRGRDGDGDRAVGDNGQIIGLIGRGG